MHDACLVLQYGQLFRAKKELAPFEKRLDRARHTLAKAKAGLLRATSRATSRASSKLDPRVAAAVHTAERNAQRALQRYEQRRAALGLFREYALAPCGAFVTFEREEGAAACLEALRGGLPYLFQPPFLRYPLEGVPEPALECALAETEIAEEAARLARNLSTSPNSSTDSLPRLPRADRHQSSPQRRPRNASPGASPDSSRDKGARLKNKLDLLRAAAAAAYSARDATLPALRLRAYRAPHPQDTAFDNLPSDLSNLPWAAAAWGTVFRRLLARLLLLAITATAVSAVVMLHSLKTDVTEATATLLGVNRTGGVSALNSLTAEQAAELARSISAEQGLGLAVSVALVTFNNLITALVGRIARFERHPTFTRREKIKLLLLAFSVTCNLGLVPILVGAGIVAEVRAGPSFTVKK